LTIFGQQPTPFLRADASRKKIKKAPARKIFMATAHCTHLPLPANAQTHPKAKSKECNRQRFVRHIAESQFTFITLRTDRKE
jgi:hypothetical protein